MSSTAPPTATTGRPGPAATSAHADTAPPALVEVRDLRVTHGPRRAAVPALDGVDLTIGRGEIVALVGETGSGKSTVAHALIGLLPEQSGILGGSVRVHPAGADPVQLVGAGERTLRRLRGAVVGLIPQDPTVSLNPTRRISGQVAEALGPSGDRRDGVRRALLEAGIEDPDLRATQYPHELSGGLRQRVLIAMAVARRPELIVADEPTSALDVTVARRILDRLETLVREEGMSLLLITHDLAVAADRSDRVIVLRDGRVVEAGTPDELLVRPRHRYTATLVAAAPGLEAAPGPSAPPRVGRPEVGRPGAASPAEAGGANAGAGPVVRLLGVGKRFALPGRRGESLAALQDVSLTVDRGRTHALVGESGSGKTTALRIALGLERAGAGRVELDGVDITNLSWRRTRPMRRRVQLVQQNPYAALDPRFTVGQCIVEPLVAFGCYDRRERRRRAAALLDQVALPAAMLNRRPAELSGGQRQRVAIARALAPEPRAILLDEPVSALDVVVQEQVLTLLRDLQDELGLSYLFVSHDLAVVALMAHTITVLRRGVVVEAGDIADVFGAPRSEYTRELLDAIPGRRARERAGGGGSHAVAGPH